MSRKSQRFTRTRRSRAETRGEKRREGRPRAKRSIAGYGLKYDKATGKLTTAAGFHVVVEPSGEASIEETYRLFGKSDVPGERVPDLSEARRALLGLGIDPKERRPVLHDMTWIVGLEWQPPIGMAPAQRRRLEQLVDRWDAAPNMEVEFDDGVLVPRIFNYYTKSGSPCVSSVRWAKRAIDSRIWSADLVHLNGFGSSLWASR